MDTTYSFIKGLEKGIVGAAIAGFSILGFILMSAYPEIYNKPVVDLLAESMRQIMGSMTVGGVIAFVVNLIKIKYS